MTYRCAHCGFKTAVSPTELCWRCAGEAALTPLQEAYIEAVRELGLTMFPHCDGNLLHARGACRYCTDPQYDRLHELRRRFSIAYSGALVEAGQEGCPAEAWRPADLIERWPGNRPAPVDSPS